MPISGVRADSHGSCPSMDSFKWCSAFCGQTVKESPLLTHPETMVFCLLGRSRPAGLPDSLPTSCDAKAPFRLCSHSQHQSSPWDPISETRASVLSPHLPQQVSRQASQTSECWSAPILCVGISLFCPLHTVAMLSSVVLKLLPCPLLVSASEGTS